jgi:predicted ATPase
VKAPNIDRPAPLAIELAAARVRAASTQSIRERLLTSRDRDVDERQRTLKATIASSYDLLDPDEQRATHSATVGRTTPARIQP